MKNFVISHFGLFEVGNYRNSGDKKPVILYGSEIYPDLGSKFQPSMQEKKSSSSFLKLLFRKLF